jgi:hypothetical protein
VNVPDVTVAVYYVLFALNTNILWLPHVDVSRGHTIYLTAVMARFLEHVLLLVVLQAEFTSVEEQQNDVVSENAILQV